MSNAIWLLVVLVIIPENYCKDGPVHGLAAWALAGGVVGRLPRERGPNRRHVPNYGHSVRFDILSIYYCRSLARTSIHLSDRGFPYFCHMLVERGQHIFYRPEKDPDCIR